MIQALTLILGLFLTYKIFISKGNYISLLWVVIPLILINSLVVVTNFPIMIFIGRWLMLSLLLSQIFSWNKFKYNWRKFPLKNVMIWVILGSIFIGVLDPRNSLFTKLNSPIRDITETYFLLFLGFVSISNEKDIYRIAKPLYYTILIVGLFALFNFISKSNPYYEFVLDNFFAGNEADQQTKRNVLEGTSERYRAVSTFSNSFDYGYISTLIGLFFLFMASRFRHVSRIKVAVFLSFIGTLLCFSRTVLLAGLSAVLIYIFLSFSLTRIFRITIISLAFVIGAYFIVPSVQRSVDNVVDIFITGGESTSGSSLSMRAMQTAGAYKYFLQEPIRGNGFGYIKKELGWGDRDKAVLDSDMLGFESIVYELMIEQGAIGIISKLALIVSILVFFFSSLKGVTKKKASLGIAIVVLFLLFSIGTGVLGAWPITMLLLGVIIKTIVIDRKNEKFIKRSFY